MGTDDYQLITGQKTDYDCDIDHMIINYVNNRANMITCKDNNYLKTVFSMNQFFYT